MKIVHIVPGSGDTFYCENCLRDGAIVKELRRAGADVVMVPMYLPLFQDNPDLPGDTPVFFGGINVYLQQKCKLFRNTPRWIDRAFDSNWLLKMVAHKAGSTRPNALEHLTVSMLKGEEGNQFKEIQRLTDWLANSDRPDLIHISNALLLGLARPLKEKLGVPLVCSLQDEDKWIDAMDPKFSSLCWDLIATEARDIDAFIAVSKYFTAFMQERMNLPHDKIHTVPVGIDTTGFKRSPLHSNPPVIGYLARMSESLGLGTLTDAFIILKQTREYQDIRLKICGGATADDRRFLARTKKKLADSHVLEDVEFLDNFHRAERIEFLQSITVLSVPVGDGSAFGSYIVESLAAGVPVVQPAVGSFPELVEASGGGLLYEPNTPEKLAETLAGVLHDDEQLRALGKCGHRSVQDEFSIHTTGSRLLSIYKDLI